MGRLSNPPDSVENLAGQGIAGFSDVPARRAKAAKRSPIPSDRAVVNNTGQLSNPDRQTIQRRLTEADVDDLVAGYRAGRSLPRLAEDFRVHRRTVAAHLEKRGVKRRVNARRMSEDNVTNAARRYSAGDSLATIGKAEGVNAETVRQALLRAGVHIRPRGGS
jgi:hypothetical protein